MSIQTSQSHGSLGEICTRLHGTVKSHLPQKNGNEVTRILEIFLLQYRCIWGSSRSTYITNVVLCAAIIVALVDKNVRQLVNRLDAAIQHSCECTDTIIYYATGQLLPGLVEPSPITITLPPNATKEQLTCVYNEELAKTKKIWWEQQKNANDERMRVEDELKHLIEDKMKCFLKHEREHEQSSLEFAFKNVLLTAGNITVNKEDDEDDKDEEGDNFVDADEVKNFFQACEHLLSICKMCQI